ncbi:hypothetical protein [Sphingomonas sp.]|uniref:hypothetical protein n=1 Tax=Sphingomonas sp. TaxID=28214 RepID=UPI002FDB7590
MANAHSFTGQTWHSVSIDRPRYERITRDVRKVCSQVGLDLPPDARDKLIHALYDAGQSGGWKTRREIRPTLADLAGAGRMAAGEYDAYIWVAICMAALLALIWFVVAPAGASFNARMLASLVAIFFVSVRLGQIWRR